MSATMTVEQMQAQIVAMQNMMATLAQGQTTLLEKLNQPKPEMPSVAVVNEGGATKLHNDPTDAELKNYAKSKGQEIRGKVTADRLDQWRALWNADHDTAVAKVEIRTNGPTVNTRWGSFESAPARTGLGIPSRAQAAETLAAHPERQTAETMTVDELRAFSQIGKDNARVAEFRNVTGITGNMRKCIGILANGKRTPNLLLVLADTIAIARQQGINF